MLGVVFDVAILLRYGTLDLTDCMSASGACVYYIVYANYWSATRTLNTLFVRSILCGHCFNATQHNRTTALLVAVYVYIFQLYALNAINTSSNKHTSCDLIA